MKGSEWCKKELGENYFDVSLAWKTEEDHECRVIKCGRLAEFLTHRNSELYYYTSLYGVTLLTSDVSFALDK
jgi:hypothetical protein